MSRLVNSEGVGKQRERMTRAVVLAMRELAAHQKPDALARDLVAFMALALEEIDATIDETCVAWEKRDYWIKADQFRTQWAWTRPMAARLTQIALQERWPELARVVPELASKLGTVTLPKRNALGEPWVGALERLRTKHPEVLGTAWRPRKTG